MPAITGAEYAASICDVFFSIGTSSLVYPAAYLATVAKSGGAIVVEVNPEETDLTRDADYVLRGKAGEIMPALVEAVKNKLRQV